MAKWEKMEDATTWDFEKNKEFVGKFVSFKSGVGKYESNIYTFRTAKGDRAVWGCAILDRRLPSLVVGQDVKVVFNGIVKNPKTGQSYKDFDVFKKPVEFEKAHDQEPTWPEEETPVQELSEDIDPKEMPF